jgi:hypothetical protein
MAVAGDVIEGKDGAIIVNGSRLEGAALDDSKANSLSAIEPN